MNVYIIRHGETNDNYQWIHQTSEAQLSEKGLRQAKILANRLKKIDIDLIITSKFIRTQQTTDIIKRVLNKPVVKSDLFIEIKRPSEVEGLKYDHPNATNIRNIIIQNFHDPKFKHSDEESFYDLKTRSQRALNYLEELKASNILVVTHGDFIRYLLGQIIYGTDFKSSDFLTIKEKFQLNNTAITLCEYENKKWKLITWNDHAHLG